MINGKIKHIIWDWNGTLFNDVELCKDIMNNLLRRFDLPLLSIEKYKEVFTFPVEDYYKKAGLDLNITSFEVLGKDFMDEYEKRKFECSLFPDVILALNYFSQKGITQSILSAYYHQTLLEIVEHYKISTYFEKLAGLDNIYAGGKFEIGKRLIAELPYRKDEIVLIGDTMHDKDVADELGIKAIIIASGHQDEARLKKLNAVVYPDMKFFINSLIGE